MKYEEAVSGITPAEASLAIAAAGFIYQVLKDLNKWLDKVIIDNIYVRNNCSTNIFVAVHFLFEGEWKTKAWFEISPGETARILSLRLDSRYVYFHAHTHAGEIWGKGDYRKQIDGITREFYKADVGAIRGKFTFNFNP